MEKKIQWDNKTISWDKITDEEIDEVIKFLEGQGKTLDTLLPWDWLVRKDTMECNLQSPECIECGKCCRDLYCGKEKMDYAEVSGDDCKKLIKQGITLNLELLGVEKIKGKNRKLRLYKLPVPCQFQKGNVCSVYEHRPLICKLYPLQKPRQSGKGYIAMLSSECPLVITFITRLWKFYAKTWRENGKLEPEDVIKFLSNIEDET